LIKKALKTKRTRIALLRKAQQHLRLLVSGNKVKRKLNSLVIQFIHRSPSFSGHHKSNMLIQGWSLYRLESWRSLLERQSRITSNQLTKQKACSKKWVLKYKSLRRFSFFYHVGIFFWKYIRWFMQLTHIQSRLTASQPAPYLSELNYCKIYLQSKLADKKLSSYLRAIKKKPFKKVVLGRNKGFLSTRNTKQIRSSNSMSKVVSKIKSSLSH